MSDPTDVRVFFGGVTGPKASGGAMAAAYVVEKGDSVTGSVLYMAPSDDASWHTATYQALAFALEQGAGWMVAPTVFMTDNEMVVEQMTGRRRAKGGHYIEAREDALDQMAKAFPARKDASRFKRVPAAENPALKLCHLMFERIGVAPWYYKNDTGLVFTSPEGAQVSWEELKNRGRFNRVTFRVSGDAEEIEFYLRPDVFQGSFQLAWTTPEERNGGTFLDCRVRSNNPDDFLSRIASLVKVEDHDGRT